MKSYVATLLFLGSIQLCSGAPPLAPKAIPDQVATTLKSKFDPGFELERFQASAEYVAPMNLGRGVEAHEFAKGEQRLAILWSTSGRRSMILANQQELTLTDRQGKATRLSALRKRIHFDLDSDPIVMALEEGGVIQPAREPEVALAQTRIALRRDESTTMTLELTESFNRQQMAVIPDTGDYFFDISPGLPRFLATANRTADFGVERVPILLRIPEAENPIARLLVEIDLLTSLEVSLGSRLGPEKTPLATYRAKNISEIPVTAIVNFADSNGENFMKKVSLDPRETYQGIFPVEITSPDEIHFYKVSSTANRVSDISFDFHLSWMTSPRAEDLAIDGELEDWPGGPPIRLQQAGQVISGKENWAGPEDASGLIYTAWDEEYFYVAAQITDDVVVDNGTAREGIELFLATTPEVPGNESLPSKTFRFILTLEGGTAKVFANEAVMVPLLSAKAEIVPNSEGYSIEAAIPHSEVRLTPQPGNAIKFGVSLLDTDASTTGTLESNKSEITWTGGDKANGDSAVMADLFFESD